MPRQNLLHGAFELCCLPREIVPCTAACLTRIARQLDAIDGEHLPPDQPLGIAGGDDRREDGRDLIANGAHKLGDRREVGRRVPAERDKGDMLATQPLDAATADHPVRVGDEDHLEEHRRWIRRRPGLVVPKSRIEAGQIDLAGEEVMDRVFKRPGDQLPTQVNRQEPRRRVDVLITSHEGGDRRRRGHDHQHPVFTTHRAENRWRVFRHRARFSYNLNVRWSRRAI